MSFDEFGHVPPRRLTTGTLPHQEHLHLHPGTTMALPPLTPAAKSSDDYNSSALILISHRYTSMNINLALTYKITTQNQL